MPTGVSLKRYWDKTIGKFISQRDTLVSQANIERLADRTNYAPMRGEGRLENIPFSFVADGKELLINLDLPDYQIEKTNVIVTVKDIADLNGNTLASPVVMDFYVYRTPLRWDEKHLEIETQYGEEYTFEAKVVNLTGKSRRFTINGLPVWITASETSGSVGPLNEQTITFTISPYINIGNFDEVIYLLGEEGMSEPLPIHIKVRGSVPEWTVDEAIVKANLTMMVIGQVVIGGRVMNDPADRLAVFGEKHRLLGVTNIKAESGLAYLTVYNKDFSETQLTYEFFDASTGIIYQVIPMSEKAENFHEGTIIGSPEKPEQFEANNGVVQTLHLKKGWNWLSFYVQPVSGITFGELMDNTTQWEVGDGLEYPKADGSFMQLTYKSAFNPKDPSNPIYTWDCSDMEVEIDGHSMYRFYSVSDKVAYMRGYTITETMNIHHGWNRISFLSQMNLPLGTALADYTEKASEGDIIKSQSEFAILTVDAQGNKQWQGTLEYMSVGQGYMLKRNAPNDADFKYPTYYTPSRYASGVMAKHSPLYDNKTACSMTVVAMADGIATEQGDILTAWRGAERCGVALADADGIFYLNVGDVIDGTADNNLTFTLERDDEVIASAGGRQMRYVPNAALGTPNEPTAINFSISDSYDSDGWYSLDGIRLSGQPQHSGVYIHNYKKRKSLNNLINET